MKSVTLRSLVRDPIQVKKLTRSGNTVQVTDRGQPLWIIKAADPEDGFIPAEEFEREMAEIRREPRSSISLSKIVIDSRR